MQSRHKEAIVHMTEQGLTPEEIHTIMAGRGMKLSRGVATIRRLQTTWDLIPDPQRTLVNRRHLMRKKAREQQKKEFERFAEELHLPDPAAWVEQKLKDPVAISRRRQHAQKMAGEGESQHDDSRDADYSGDESINGADWAQQEHPEHAPVADAQPGEGRAQPDTGLPILDPLLEEADAGMIHSLGMLISKARAFKQVLEARAQGKPVKESLAGLPPTPADVAAARQNLSAEVKSVLDIL